MDTPAGTSETPVVERHEEFHATIEGIDPIIWHRICLDNGIKPLYIELSTRNLQIMCAMHADPRQPEGDLVPFEQAIKDEGGKIVRLKREVSELAEGETPIYYECHVKLDGPVRWDRRNVSRDLYRVDRWYVTKRSPSPFNAEEYVKLTAGMTKGSKIAGFEYEICIEDTNPSLDLGWIGQPARP